MKKTIEDLVRDGFHIPVAGDIYPFYGRRFLVAAGSNYPCIDCSFADKDCPETVRCDNEISGIYFMVITSAEDNHESGSGGIGKEGCSASVKKKTPQQQVMDKKPEWISLDLWVELIANRKMKKLSNSDLALTTFLKAVQKAVDRGYSPGDCIAEFVQARWTRFNVDWMPPINKSENGVKYDR